MSILERNLQISLNFLHDWCRENGLVLNTEKTKRGISHKQTKRYHLHIVSFSLQYDGIDIKMTTSDQILGVYVDDSLSLNGHFHHVPKTVSSYLWL